MLSSLFRHLLLLLRRDFPFPSLTSDVLGSLVLHLASQLSSPTQKRVMRFVNAAIILGLFLAEVPGGPFVADAVLESR